MDFPKDISVKLSHSSGSYTCYEFDIVNEDLDSALISILNWITPEISVLFADHRRGDSEGAVVVELKSRRLGFMRGGHGYSSDWFDVEFDKLVRELKETVDATQWGAKLGNGYIHVNS